MSSAAPPPAKRTPWFAREAVGWAILIGVVAGFAVLKVVFPVYLYGAGLNVSKIMFGFGGYVGSLNTDGVFAACLKKGCATASRMPLLPVLYHLLSYISLDQRVLDICKNVLMSAIFASAFFYLLAIHRRLNGRAIVVWCLILPLLLRSPNVIKHVSSLDYGEGIIAELLFLWAYTCLLLALAFADAHARRCRSPLAVLIAALGLAIFLTKSSMLLVLLVSAGLALGVLIGMRDWRPGLALALCIVTVGAWGIRNEVTSGRFTIMTSWDGSNAYSGWNSTAAKLYPDVVLDRLFDSDKAYLRNGSVVAIPRNASPDSFRNEWAWNDYYNAKARDWALSHLSEAAAFTAKKLFVFFLGLQKTPYSYTNDARVSEGSRFERLVTTAWLALGRLFEFLLLAMLGLLLYRDGRRGRFLALGTFAVLGAYAAPYVVGFGYERHITVFLLMVGVGLAVNGAELWRMYDPDGTLVRPNSLQDADLGIRAFHPHGQAERRSSGAPRGMGAKWTELMRARRAAVR